jgi:tetratricopeptide (TPR) repeat protein
MAKIETALATGRAKQALDVIGGLKTNTFVKNDQDQLRQRIALRRVQALLALGRKDEAQGVLNKAGISLQDMLTAPQAMAAIAELFYASKQYGRARPVYSQLPAVLGSDEEKAMAMWRAGMCLWRDGYLELARILLQNIVDDYAHTAAKFRARLSLADMKVQETLPKVRMEQVFTYKTVAARAPERLVREEAGLKHIVALYQLEELDKAAEELTVFLAYFAAGPLQHEARALLVELIPNLVPTLFAKDEMVKGLALVAKHRDTLVKTDLGADFLWSMGDAFASLGLYRRASRVFLYLLARTDDETQQKRLYARLLHLWSKQGRWGDIVQYTEVYAQKYPNGRHSAEIMALAAKILLDNGQHEKALQWLLDTSRPFSRELDLLTVRALSESGDYERIERYLQRSWSPQESFPPEIFFAWAKAKSVLGDMEQALSLLQEIGRGKSDYSCPALFQAAELLAASGQQEAAIKTYRELAEKGEGTLWAELAQEGSFLAQNEKLFSKTNGP